ncbi:MAG: LysR substrate-binding domain-containing protein [Pseudomonadota bacterium]
MQRISYDGLKVFDAAARAKSFSAAADALNLTKGAVSYQIKRLEEDLGFAVFDRVPRGVELTEKGRRLWHASQSAFRGLDREIRELQEDRAARITIGMSTYFASRWLSQRLMRFTDAHQDIGLRLQPTNDLIDFSVDQLDMAIRWGAGRWRDMQTEPLFSCPAFPTANAGLAEIAENEGVGAALAARPLLHDRDGSGAWRDWHQAAGLPYQERHQGLAIPDPNVRVQAVMDGQGIALNDALVSNELGRGKLFRISAVELADYGYHLAYPAGAMNNPALSAFRDWIVGEGASEDLSFA